ncbi:hypothetical protein H310_03663 [Aphanomyces invadans]|uniref:Suppressor of forked domain-containing protein n=1 Tax=Aphanomyces invadans TaxID=157072 RepID=A0A024UKD0_9STRA|nr:hypothetical protein H310_03663 [Aphanomyces invadans]ETW06068.1 hypothetical protein H310_03663 [Aphanomyces invadans]|eukprot:XP_008865845.1 hypothetical protein H310_03663 [Aphanomyces invadans]
MSALMDGNPMLSDDSSEEDEPIAIPTQHTAAHVGGDVDMGGGADEDEDEDMAAADDPTAGKHPKLRRLYAAARKEPWNIDAWLSVMYEVQQSFQHVEEARPFYVLFLEQFPTSAYWWKQYADHEWRANQLENVRAIFTKALQEIKLPHVELWAFYLQFTKSTVMDVLTEANSPEDKKRARQQMTEAFESALDRVGTSIHSNGIWTQYLHFLKDDKEPTAIFSIRKVFQRALPIPMHNLDALWKDYEQFEKSIPNNEALALNVFKVLRPKVDAAKAIFKDRKALVDPIDLDALPSRTNTDPQIDAWNKWIEFELANPERVERPKWKAKVRYVLEACLACRRYSAEVWFQYAMLELPDVAATSAIFQQALEAMPESCLLRFAYADHLESHGLVDDARAVYESLLEATASPIGYITYMRFARRAFGNKGLDASRQIFKRARRDPREGACTYHVYTAAALLEFHSGVGDEGKQIALNIFELGLKKHIHEPDYVLSYVDFLGHTNDDNNMRSLFEKVLSVIPAAVSKPVWDRFIRFEQTMATNGGDLTSVVRLEQRRAAALPDDITTKGLLGTVDRYVWMHLLDTSKSDELFFATYGSTFHSTSGHSASSQPTTNTTLSGSIKSSVLKSSDMIYHGPPLPDFLKAFAAQLPLGVTWNGPVADPDMVFQALCYAEFPSREEIERLDALDGGEGNGNVLTKRPTHDVFRDRQKQRLAKLS